MFERTQEDERTERGTTPEQKKGKESGVAGAFLKEPRLGKPTTYAVHCKAGPGYALSTRGGAVILAPVDRSDECQHWFREDKLSARVMDEHGFPSFSLVNKATGKAVGHPDGAGRPVELVPHDRDGVQLDGSVLWTVAGEDGDEFKAIRMQNNVRLNMDALGGVKESGGIRDGTVVGVWEWNGGDNQRVVAAAGNNDNILHHHHHHFSHQDHHHYHHYERNNPCCLSEDDTTPSDTKQTYRVYCKADAGFSLTADGAVFLAPNDPSDPRQRWVKEDRRSALVRDKDGFPSFVLVNKATRQAIKHPDAARKPVKLVPYDDEDGEGAVLDGSLLWTAGDDGCKAICAQNNTSLCMDALKGTKKLGGVREGTVVGMWEWNEGDNQLWSRCRQRQQQPPPPPLSLLRTQQPRRLGEDDTTSADNKQTYRVYCKADAGFSLTADGAVFLAPNDPADPRQHWVKEDRRSALVTDKDGFPSFALVNKATGQAIKHGPRTPVKLVPYDDDGEGAVLDGSLLWTAADVAGDDGYKAIRVQNNTLLCAWTH
ncbi:unnamed protein product [Cuscuta campestris]|uniref:Uncharacterized protein n=1 Tax=Cuscuta campestris TaxID=132261 RepID=A0A484KVW0_9ASTE|nr:unnamed protein product [Cuscuta campestris]